MSRGVTHSHVNKPRTNRWAALTISLCACGVIGASCTESADKTSGSAVTRDTAVSAAASRFVNAVAYVRTNLKGNSLEVVLTIKNNDSVDVAFSPQSVYVYWLPSRKTVMVEDVSRLVCGLAIDSTVDYTLSQSLSEPLRRYSAKANHTFVLIPPGTERMIRVIVPRPASTIVDERLCRYLSGSQWLPLWRMDDSSVASIVSKRTISRSHGMVVFYYANDGGDERLNDDRLPLGVHAIEEDEFTLLETMAVSARDVRYTRDVAR